MRSANARSERPPASGISGALIRFPVRCLVEQNADAAENAFFAVFWQLESCNRREHVVESEKSRQTYSNVNHLADLPFMSQNQNRNLTRLERKTTGGYLLRMMRQGYMYTQFFSDREYGGKRKSVLAARKVRDELESELKGYTSKDIAKRERSNNTSGIVGVRLVEETDPRWESKPKYQYWVAQWSPSKGTRRTKRFSVDKYGYDEAYRLALKARKAGVAAMKT